ncbi:class I SAM-dependent methyltransferase [Nostoc sp.]|uniref:class I SAM-dependent methyltransferase n=1 Tax=Nostoc sp. TaxID=1180 RepID=UPI002FF77718
MVEETYFVKTKVANKYDGYIGENIPFYWPALNFIGKSVSEYFSNKDALDCIEIGSGSANLSITVSQYIQLKSLLLLDHSAPFLEIAKQKLSETPSVQITPILKHASFLSDDWQNDIEPNSKDLILSSLTLDHIADDEEFLSLLKKLQSLLKKGGCFVTAEKCASSSNTTKSWQSFAKMIHIRGENNLKNNFKNASEIEAWKHHNFTEDILRPFSDVWTLVEKAGLTVKYAGGVPLPEPDNLNYDTFYELNKVRSFTRQEVFSSEQAFGVAILICKK